MENLVVNEPIKQNLLSAMKWLNFLTIFFNCYGGINWVGWHSFLVYACK